MKSQRSNSVGNQQLGQFLKILNPESEIKQEQQEQEFKRMFSKVDKFSRAQTKLN